MTGVNTASRLQAFERKKIKKILEVKNSCDKMIKINFTSSRKWQNVLNFQW